MDRLSRVLDRQGFEGNRIVVALPEDKLLSNTFEQVGQGTGAPMGIVSRVELARSAGCAPPQLETACWSLPAPARARQSTHVLAVGCLHSEADALLDAVEQTGMRAAALEPRSVALARACGPMVAGREGICAVTDLAWEGATTTVLYRSTVVYHRFVPELGIGVVSRTLVQGLGVDDELASHLLLGGGTPEAPTSESPRTGPRADAAQLTGEHASRLAHEVGLSLSYASHWYAQPQVDLVLLCGEGASMPGVAPMLRSGVGVEIGVARLGGATRITEEWGWHLGPAGGTELMAAVGLALR
jgi:Tfp pilus assembly PilM family ATPase